MKIDYPKIKKFLHIGIFGLDLVIFLIIIFCTSTKNPKYKSYTDVVVFFLDIYIIAIYIVLILNTIMPNLLYPKLSKYCQFIFTDKGKVIISFLISMIYWFAKNGPQFTLGVLLFITSFILLAYEFIFYFAKVEKFLSSKGIEFINKDKGSFSDIVIGGKNVPAQSSGNNVAPTPENSMGGQHERNVEIANSYDNNQNNYGNYGNDGSNSNSNNNSNENNPGNGNSNITGGFDFV